MLERLISFASPEENFYGALALGPAGEEDGSVAGLVSGPEGSLTLSDATASRGEGTLRVAAGAGELVVGLAAHTSALGFETGLDRSVSVQAVGASVEINGAGDEFPDGGFEASGVAWKVEGEQDQAAMRTIWSMLADGSLFVLFSLRPEGSDEHGTETIGAVRIAKDGGVTAYGEPLLSTEYDASGRHTRATLELWGDEEGGPATRGAGGRTAGGRAALGDAKLDAARFDWRVDGAPGFGGYEIFRG